MILEQEAWGRGGIGSKWVGQGKKEQGAGGRLEQDAGVGALCRGGWVVGLGARYIVGWKENWGEGTLNR